MEITIEAAFVILLTIIVSAVIISSSMSAEQKRGQAVQEITGRAKKVLQITMQPESSVTWSPADQRYSSYAEMKYRYRLSLPGLGIKNTEKTDISATAVLQFKGVTIADPGVIQLTASTQDYLDFDFTIESSEPPLIKASDLKQLGVIADEKTYDMDSAEKNAKLDLLYGVGLSDLPALFSSQSLVINDFVVKASPFLIQITVVGIKIKSAFCQVPVSISCKDQQQMVVLRVKRQDLESWTTDSCGNDPDDICKRELGICGGNIMVSLIGSNKECNVVKGVVIETVSRADSEDRRRYQLGEEAVLSFWKAGSECWKEPLKVGPGCEDDFYGAFNILIPAERYNKEGMAPQPLQKRTCMGIDAPGECTRDDYGNECYWTAYGMCMGCSPDELKCVDLTAADCTTGKCGVSNCVLDREYGCMEA